MQMFKNIKDWAAGCQGSAQSVGTSEVPSIVECTKDLETLLKAQPFSHINMVGSNAEGEGDSADEES